MYEIKNHKLYKDGKQVNWFPTKNKSGVIKPLYIVVHDTASPLSPQGDINWLAGIGNNGSSAHFVVARDGNITQLSNCNVGTWHAGQSKWNGKSNCNSFTIGIEIDNPGKMIKVGTNQYKSYYGILVDDDKVDFVLAQTPQHGSGYWATYTPQQIEAVIGMCQAMIKFYGCTEIITHWQISPGRKVDTNPLFPLEMVRERAFGNRSVKFTVQPEIKFVEDATVLVDNLNLRATPQMGQNIITELSKGTRVDVQGLEGDWYRVMLSDNRGGYLYKNFIKLD